MSALKTWALTVVAWGTLATVAQAEPLSLLWDWTAWSAQSGVAQGNTTPPPPPPPPPPPTPAPPAHPDIYLNFGNSSYPEQSTLTTGTAQPWYDSPSVTKVFGGVPNSQQQQDFISSVQNDLQHTFDASGFAGSTRVSLTTNPTGGGRHTMSIVSGLSYGPNPNAIGITDVGANGFSFIDKLSYASNPGDLEWAVAHNLAHEAMHAFGVGYHPDATGTYLDAASVNWSLLTNPDATLSPAAQQAIVADNIGRNGNTSMGVGGETLQVDGEQEVLAPVPEPTTIAFWGLAATALVLHQRRRAGRRRAAA